MQQTQPETRRLLTSSSAWCLFCISHKKHSLHTM